MTTIPEGTDRPPVKVGRLPSQRRPADSRPAQADAIAARALADHRIWSEGFKFGHACGHAEGHDAGEAAADLVWMNALGIARRTPECQRTPNSSAVEPTTAGSPARSTAAAAQGVSVLTLLPIG